MLSDFDETAESAVVVAVVWQGQGIATLLLHELANYAILAGVKKIKGYMLSSNRNMYRLANELGFKTEPWSEDHQKFNISGDLCV